MKILLDTNVLISAFITNGGHCHEILTHAVHQHEMYYTDFILDEFKEKFRKKFNFSSVMIGQFVDFLERFLSRGKTAEVVERICRDANDDQILADALENKVDVVLTGDLDLLVLKIHRGVQILHPKDYWSLPI